MKPRLLFIPAIHGFQNPGNGGQLRTRGLIEGLLREFEIDIYSAHYTVGNSENNVEFTRNICPKWQRILICGLTTRIIGRVIRLAAERILPAPCQEQSNGNDIYRSFITTWLQGKAAYDYDIILFDTLLLAPFHVLPEIRRKVWFSLHNVDSILHPTSTFYAWHEANFTQFSQGVITCTEKDRQIITSMSHGIKSLVWPNGCFPPSHDLKQGAKEFDIAFVGSLDYPPNIEGLRFYFQQVAPLLKRELRLLVIGRNPSKETLAFLRSQNNTIVQANVDSVEFWLLQAHISMVPLLSGSGSRLKIAESLILGLPCISTEIGADGYPQSTHGLIVVPDKDAHAFAANIERLINQAPNSQVIQGGASQFLWSNTIRPKELLTHITPD